MKYFYLLLLIPVLMGQECTWNCEPEEFSVETFNIRFGDDPPNNNWSQRRDLVFDMLDDYSPDILSLQEAEHDPETFDPDDPLATQKVNDILHNYPEYSLANPLELGLFAEYVLYKPERFLLDSVETITVQKLDGAGNLKCPIGVFEWDRYITKIRFMDNNAVTPVHIFNVHLCPGLFNVGVRKQHIIALMNLTAQIPITERIIITADLNSEDTTDIYGYVVGTSTLLFGGITYTNPVPLVDTFKLLNPVGPDGTFNGFLSVNNYGTTGKRIDYIFTNIDNAIKSDVDHRWAWPTFPSDHYGVITKFPAQMHMVCF